MKSLFYGGAIAAVAGLALGAGLKAPLAVEDAEAMPPVSGFETAELNYDAPQPVYFTADAVTPVSAPAYTVEGADQADVTPAVYTVEEEEPAPAPVATYELTAADEPPMNLIRSARPQPEPDVVDQSQGFGLAEVTPAASF